MLSAVLLLDGQGASPAVVIALGAPGSISSLAVSGLARQLGRLVGPHLFTFAL